MVVINLALHGHGRQINLQTFCKQHLPFKQLVSVLSSWSASGKLSILFIGIATIFHSTISFMVQSTRIHSGEKPRMSQWIGWVKGSRWDQILGKATSCKASSADCDWEKEWSPPHTYNTIIKNTKDDQQRTGILQIHIHTYYYSIMKIKTKHETV